MLAIYYALPGRWRWTLLLAASYFFYMSWNAFYAILIVLSTITDYVAAQKMYDAKSLVRKRLWLSLSMLTNLGLLFTFKYWNFFFGSLGMATEFMGVPWSVPLIDVLLPVGISFYTFQTMSYTIDVYRGEMEPERHLGYFAVFVTFFPQLLAGKIERESRLITQLKMERQWDWDNLYMGSQKILCGIFKKVIIADRLAMYVQSTYSSVGQHDSATYLLATYAFALQIYCDFSGYSDIAIGSARLFGIDLMENFRQPYFATNLRDFWRRWHISLSNWLRDYLYIPLGGNRAAAWRVKVNLMITMLLGGLWHGASWNFVIWGALQGAGLMFLQATSKQRERMWSLLNFPEWLKTSVAIAITFHYCCLSWVFFRAETLSDALHIVAGIARFDLVVPAFKPNTMLHAAAGIALLLLIDNVQRWRGSGRDWVGGFAWPVRWACWYAMFFMVVLLGVQGRAQFIYFQF